MVSYSRIGGKKMEKGRNIKVLSLAALIVAVLGLTVAFAALSQQLTINGQATVDAATWDIHFANLSEPVLTGGAQVVTAPTIQENSTAIKTFELKLTKPGDSVKYTFDVVNAGSIDATLATVVPERLQPVCTGTGAAKTEDENIVCNGNHLTYKLTYTATGEAVKATDELNHGETKNLTLELSFDITQNGALTIANDVQISALDITLNYAQK